MKDLSSKQCKRLEGPQHLSCCRIAWIDGAAYYTHAAWYILFVHVERRAVDIHLLVCH